MQSISFKLDDIKNEFCSLSARTIDELAEERKSEGTPLCLAIIEKIATQNKTSYDFFEAKAFDTYRRSITKGATLTNPSNRVVIKKIAYIWNKTNQKQFTAIPNGDTNAFTLANEANAKNCFIGDQIKYAEIFLQNSETKNDLFWIRQIYNTTSNQYFYQKIYKFFIPNQFKKTYHSALSELSFHLSDGKALIEACLFIGPQKSNKFLEKFVENNPGNALALTLIAQIHIENKDPDKASECLTRALAVEKNNPLAWELLISCDPTSALALLTQYADEVPTLNDHTVHIINCFLKRKKSIFDTSILELLQKAVKQKPPNAYVHFYLGSILQIDSILGKKDIFQALHYIECAVKFEPNNKIFLPILNNIRIECKKINDELTKLNNNAMMYMKGDNSVQPNWTEALKYFELMLSLDPKKICAIKAKAKIFYEGRNGVTANWVEALKYSELALSLEPRNLYVLMTIAKIFMLGRNGVTANWVEALKYLELALSLNPKNLHALIYKASIFIQGGNGITANWIEASKYFELALSLDPKNMLAVTCIEKIWFRGGNGVTANWIEALKYNEWILSLDPNNLKAIATKATIFIKGGYGVPANRVEALKCYEVLLNSSLPESLNLAIAVRLLANKETDLARQFLYKVLTLNTSNKEATELLQLN